MQNSNAEAEIARQLAADILNGKKHAEERMIVRYDRGLRYMLKHRSQCSELADEVAQETWRIVIEKVRRGALKDPSKLSAYIVQTGKNQLLMHYRNQKTQINLTDAEEQLKEPSQLPEALMEKFKLSLVVKQVLKELKMARDKELIIRFYLEEQSKNEVCKALDLTPTHFDRVLHRAKQRFQQIWITLQKTEP